MQKKISILQNNFTGLDLSEISIKTGFSPSKVQKYLKGEYKNEGDYKKIIDTSITYFCEKYKAMIEIMEGE